VNVSTAQTALEVKQYLQKSEGETPVLELGESSVEALEESLELEGEVNT
jgi:hypothetical protein